MPPYDPVWWRAQAQDLQRVSERVSSLYVERCHIDRDENAVVLVNKDRTIRVPSSMLAVILIGPGTRVTHAAVTLLGDSGTAMCWVGEQGVRFYAAGVGGARSSRILRRQAWLVSRRAERVAVARQMYSIRFPGEDVSGLSMQQLRGREGARIRAVYRAESERTGVPWMKREYRAGDAFAAGDDVNRLLSAGHSYLYGVVHAAVVGVGATPGLGFVHSGSWQSFVLDIADLYKADLTIPLAFDLAATSTTSESDMRRAVRDRFATSKLLPQIVRDIKYLLLADPSDDEGDADVNELWDDELGSVPGGVNWGPRIIVSGDEFESVVGPDLAKSVSS